jgi:hypothetical protein
MRRTIRLFLATFLLITGAVTLAAPALAASAAPYRYTDCFTDGAYEICFSGRGVVKEQSTPSGNVLFKASGTSTYTIRENGVLIEQGSGRDNFVLHEKSGEPHVYHSNGKGQFTFDGVTCTYRYNVTYANGELRHVTDDFRCDG